MTPKALMKSLQDADLREVVKEVLAWHETGVRTGDSLDKLARKLVTDCGAAEDTYGLLQMVEALALAEAARRFADFSMSHRSQEIVMSASNKVIGQMMLTDLKKMVNFTHRAGTNAVPVLIPSMPDCTSISKDDAFEAGKNAALSALEKDSSCFLGLMDELRDSEAEMAYAKGWNSVWASPANKDRGHPTQI